MALMGGMGAPPYAGGIEPQMPPLIQPQAPVAPLAGGMSQAVDATAGIKSIAENIAAGFSKDPARRAQYQQQLQQEDAQRQQELQVLREHQMHYMDQMTELAANGGWTPALQQHTQAACKSIDQLMGAGSCSQWHEILAAADASHKAQQNDVTAKIDALKQAGMSPDEIKQAIGARIQPDTLSPEAEQQKIRIAVAERPPQQPQQPQTIGVINLKMPDGTVRGFRNVDQAGIQDALSKGAVEIPASALDQKTPDANPLRAQFNQLDAPYRTVKRNADIIMNSDETPQGDIALVYSYVHVLDPTASVQQGDFLNATNTPGIEESIRQALNKAIQNQSLTPQQRASYRSQTAKITDKMQGEHDKLTKQYSEIGKATGIPDEQLFGSAQADVSAGSSQDHPVGATSPEEAAKLPSGTWFTTTDGRVVQRK